METIKIYLLREDAESVVSGDVPSKFWYFKPNEFNKEDIVEMNISTQRLKEWSGNGASGKKILFG